MKQQQTAAPAAPKITLRPAPRVNSGEAIELSPLMGKTVAIQIHERCKQQTKFGERDMSTVTLVCEGEAEPLYGVLFQSYFQRLPIGEWIVGVVVKAERAWGLDAEAVKPPSIAKLEKQIAALPEVPF